MPEKHIIDNNLLNLLQVFDTGILGIETIEVDFENQVKDLSQQDKDKIILNFENNHLKEIDISDSESN